MTAKTHARVQAIKEMCQENYERGGDYILECFTDEEIAKQFKSKKAAKDYCGLQVEQASNARWGEDDDPELASSEAFKEWV